MSAGIKGDRRVVKKTFMPALLFAALAVAACAPPPAPDARSDGEGSNNSAPVKVRVATYNAYLNRETASALRADLQAPDNPQIRAVAEIIQRVAPDVILLNEFDYDPTGESLSLFQRNFLEISQNGAPPAIYPYAFSAPVNTGQPSGRDLDRDGVADAPLGTREYGNDAWGYGVFPGQYGMAILSKHPIDESAIRTFRNFLWQDMPGALLPDNPDTPQSGDWYDDDALSGFPLSSKSHWDAPIIVNGRRLRLLASHPTPPGFDGAEQRNKKRNHDEIRFWADYISTGSGDYIYDDSGGRGGVADDAPFIIMGDLNADPVDGNGVPGAIGQLLDHPRVNSAFTPVSAGGVAAACAQGGANDRHKGDPAADTADFNDDPERGAGNLRVDYVLPSAHGLDVLGGGVFWPAEGEAHYDLIGPGYPVVSSDHRLVWLDLQLTAE